MYRSLLAPSAVCGDLGACKSNGLVAYPDCEECVDAVRAVIDAIITPEKLNTISYTLTMYFTVRLLLRLIIHNNYLTNTIAQFLKDLTNPGSPWGRCCTRVTQG